MGAQPAEVIDRVRELGWQGRGRQTDEVLWRPEEQDARKQLAPKLRRYLELDLWEYAPATREMLGEERVAWLRELPAQKRLEDLALVHAAPSDLWRAPLPDAEDDELSAAYEPLDAATAVYGHIHRPYTRALKRLTVANSGSVGMPWDGDPRALLSTSSRTVNPGWSSANTTSSGRPPCCCVAVIRMRCDWPRCVAAELSSSLVRLLRPNDATAPDTPTWRVSPLPRNRKTPPERGFSLAGR